MRNNTKSAMFSMSSLLEAMSDLLHLRTLLGWKRIQKKVSKTKLGCSLYPALRNQEGTTSWCSARQNWRTERVLYRFQRVEEMSIKSWRSRRTLPRNSRSFSKRSSLSWIATQNWLERAKVHRDGQIGTRKSQVPSIQREIPEISRTMVSHIE